MAGRTTWVLALVASTVVVGLAGCINTDAAHGEPKPEVVVTIYPLAFVTHWIAGDDLHVETLVPAGLPPAEWEPSPSDVIRASEARLLVTNGAGLDGWIAPVAQAVRASGGIVVEATAGLHLMDAGKYEEQEKRDTPAPGAAGEDGHDHGHDHGHSHGDPADAAAAPVAADQRPADPHTWLDPLRLAAMADNILAGLVALDPGRADDWNTRAGELRGALAGLHERYSEGLRHCDNRHLFTTRNAFGYLDHRYNLYQHGVLPFDREAEPTPGRLLETIEAMGHLNATAVFHEAGGSQAGARVADVVSEATGARRIELHTLAGLSLDDRRAGHNLFTLMDQNLERLREGLGCR